MASSQSSPSKSVSKDPSQLDPDTQIDTDCICASALTPEEKTLVYDKTIPQILTLYRSGRIPKDDEAVKIAGRICADAKGMRESIPDLRPNPVANAVIKFMLYIITKDLGISGKKVESIVGIAYAVIYKAITQHFQVWEWNEKARKNTRTIMGFWDPIFFNDSIMELCRDGKTGLDPFRTLNDEGEPLKVHVKAYRNFHELLLKLDKDEMLTGYTKATVGYLAVKMYFDNKEKAKKQNDILWVTAQWFDQASEDIFRWRRAEVSNVWSQWRDDLGDRETELRRAREEHEQGDPGQLEKSLVAAREEMRVVLGRMLEEKRRVAAYRAGQSTSE
ncbi:hypothetical protein UCREL1_8606 [Eutypa lata UCREL1]|uniref:Uncharacterized protein n=1 Tax=Eutypa lata (strain UCR-EL1) TaxID=1287681 RepID=M7TCL1_EUTLA|nr:hypothetical protein UCREL1_8606 [Eutypa lata UCREL1]